MSRKRTLTPQAEMTIAQSLREWRKAKKWTRKQAADHLGISWRTLESWELGYREPPSLNVLDKLWGTRRK